MEELIQNVCIPEDISTSKYTIPLKTLDIEYVYMNYEMSKR